jgi:two-component system, NtrC family, response regulator HydG
MNADNTVSEESEVRPSSPQKPKLARVVVVEDDVDTLEILEAFFKQRGYEVLSYDSAEKALKKIAKGIKADVILTDWNFLGMNGIEFIEKMKVVSPEIPIVLMTSRNSTELALKAVEAGAYDFLLKPINFPQLHISIQRALHWRSVNQENAVLRSAVEVAKGNLDGVIFKSEKFKGIIDLCRRVANSQATVLISGESGSGKEVVARSIHRFSKRRDKPFIALNCSAIPETLLESELFGHAKGSFTGASDKKVGMFEEANGGTLFLDEIGDLSMPLQAKLLRVIQERTIKRIGENEHRPIDVRIIAATHKSLADEVRARNFREDLFFRLNVIPLRVPALRERRDDILILAHFFLNKFRVLNGKSITAFSKAAMQHLMSYNWPGNVRELENSVERAVVLAEGPEVELADLQLNESLYAGMDTSSLLLSGSSQANGQTASPDNSVPAIPPVNNGSLSEDDEFMMNEAAVAKYNSSSNNNATPVFRDYAESLSPSGFQFTVSESVTVSELVSRYIRYVLDKNNGAKDLTARELGVDRKTLYRKLKTDSPTDQITQ